MFSDTKPGWIIFLSCLLSFVMDLAVHHIPSVPVIQLKGTGSVLPEPLLALLKAFHGPDELQGKNFQIKRPSYIRAFTPLWAAAPSSQPEDYFGGYVKVHGKKKYFWLPLRNAVIAIAANVPQDAWNKVLEQSSHAVPVFCSTAPKLPSRTVLAVDGTAFQTVDTKKLKKLKKQRKEIYLLFVSFNRWLRRKKRHWKQCINDAANYYPKIQNGRFVTTNVSDEVRIMAFGLAVFKQFLHYASEKKWLTHGEAQSLLDEAWGRVLPESFSQANTGAASGTAAWNNSDVFWKFLCGYLQDNQQHISLKGTPCASDVVAAIREVNDDKLLILPREQIVNAYIADLVQKGITPPEKKEKQETEVQRAITNWGIRLKDGGKDITWRYRFYSKPLDGKQSIPCLGIPLDQLPLTVINRLSDLFGKEFDQWMSPKASRNESEHEKVMENV